MIEVDLAKTLTQRICVRMRISGAEPEPEMIEGRPALMR